MTIDKKSILMLEPKIIQCNELRRYMGVSNGPIPRGAIVKLYAKVYIGRWWRVGFFEWDGEKWFAPIRCLWRVENDQASR